MTQYYFHLENEHTIKDDQGEQYKTLAEAKAHAREVAQQLSAHQTEQHNRSLYIRVVDEEGREVFRTSLVVNNE
jgi:hypothetical protein